MWKYSGAHIVSVDKSQLAMPDRKDKWTLFTLYLRDVTAFTIPFGVTIFRVHIDMMITIIHLLTCVWYTHYQTQPDTGIVFIRLLLRGAKTHDYYHELLVGTMNWNWHHCTSTQYNTMTFFLTRCASDGIVTRRCLCVHWRWSKHIRICNYIIVHHIKDASPSFLN